MPATTTQRCSYHTHDIVKVSILLFTAFLSLHFWCLNYFLYWFFIVHGTFTTFLIFTSFTSCFSFR